MGDGSTAGGEQPEMVEIERQKVSTMLHHLTITRERERLTPMGDEHLENACEWLERSLHAAGEDD